MAPAPVYPPRADGLRMETLPIQTQSVPGVALQPVPDPTTVIYPSVGGATLILKARAANQARTALEAAGVTVGYYGVFLRPDGLFQLWPNNLLPLPGLKVE